MSVPIKALPLSGANELSGSLQVVCPVCGGGDARRPHEPDPLHAGRHAGRHFTTDDRGWLSTMLRAREQLLCTCRAAWQPRTAERLAGVLEKYARLVGPARLGAVTHSGAVEWPREPGVLVADGSRRSPE